MSSKRFEEWNIEKQIIHAKTPDDLFINVREIWFVKMGQNIGYEENGKEEFLRPVLVLKKVGNMFFTVALTSRGKDNHVFYHKFNDIHLHNPRYEDSSYAILSQARVIDKRRFFEYAGNISKEEFQVLKQKLRALLL
jgi:mRNA interferase MazF